MKERTDITEEDIKAAQDDVSRSFKSRLSSNRRIAVFVMLGTVIVAAVFIFITIMSAIHSSKGTEESVDMVSEFYLDELANNRADIVETELKSDIDTIYKAVEIIDDNVLSSQETLREFFGRVRILTGFDRFALVDANGIVYTRNSTSSGLSRYTFLSDEITEPIIRTSNLYGARKQVVLAVPVEGIYFQGTEIKVCFAQINIDEMISSLTFQDENTTTYVNLYYQNGENLTNISFGTFSENVNFLDEMKNVEYAEGYSYDTLVADFASGTSGEVAYTINGLKSYISYIPVSGTNWMLAVMIRDNAIRSQITTVSQGMQRRSNIQIIITVLTMFILFAYIVLQSRKASQEILEKEKLDSMRIRAALEQAEYRQQEMETIHGALGSGPWSMEFDELGEMTTCIWSDTLREMIGYSSTEDFPDRLESWSELIVDEDRERVLNAYWDTVRDASNKLTFDEEYRLQTRDRGIRWFHSIGRLTRRADGTPVTFFGMFIDVDDQKKSVLALGDALDAAQQASRSKSVFLSNMSHDIRTPMNAIIGFTELAEKRIDNRDQVADYLDKIESSSRHLLALINDVLDMSKIESGNIQLEEQPTHISDIMEDIKSMTQAGADSKQITASFDMYDIENENILVDCLRLNQILINLTGNAIKFTKPGGRVNVSIRQLGEEKSGKAPYEIVVSDTGIGMSKEFLERVFVPFERERTSTVSGIQGTGLGMSITKNLVELMSGTIEVESEEGVGTTFTVRMSLHVCDGSEVCRDRVKEASEDTEFKPEEISLLLVEDNMLNREIAEEILRGTGFKVKSVEDGSIAVEEIRRAKTGDYDMILMDIQMPIMDGYEATRQIRAMHDSKLSQIPIVAMTANAFDEDKQKAYSAGMNGHVAKPIDKDNLVDTIRVVLKAARG